MSSVIPIRLDIAIQKVIQSLIVYERKSRFG